VPQEIRGDIPTGTFHITWYRPIEAYIQQDTQIIAGNGMLYISTARGIYALDAVTGALRWRYDTEIPLGNSPTLQDGILYVGGYDHKVHVLNATNGAHLWTFDGATAGYSTNPLVVNGMVIAANRDGNLYAFGAYGTPQQGHLIWKFQAGRPIEITPAYKNGVVYFAAIDNYAYAVNATNGSLIWKSQRLLGDGYQSYWPVIYTNPTTNKDVVIFSGDSGYRYGADPGTRSLTCSGTALNSPDVPCETTDFYKEDLFASWSSTLGPTVSIGDAWAQGKTIVDFSHVTEYLENNPAASAYLHKPWRRYYAILNADNGSEYTFDSDHDGYPEYAPIIPFNTNSGDSYPPVVGYDNLLYFSTLYNNNGQGRVAGWRIGTKYLSLTPASGDSVEPQALSGGGKLIFRSICCDRVGDWYDITSKSTFGSIWGYNNLISDMAPGYDQMWWFPSLGNDRLYGNFGNVNGIYHNHGVQNPIIPYMGRYYIHRSNAIIAFGPGQVYGKQPLLTINRVTDTIQQPTISDLEARLETEVRNILAAGHLRPGYYNAGQFNSVYYDLVDYFNNPGDTLYTLSIAYPYLSPDLQAQTKNYLKTEFQTYFNPNMYAQIGWADGAARDAVPLPPEIQSDLKNHPKTQWPGYGYTWQYPQNNFYAMWKYVLVAPEDTSVAYALAKSKITVPVPNNFPISIDEWFARRPWEVNGYIEGYIGFLRLQELAGKTVEDGQLRTSVTNELNRLLQYRANTFTKDTYYKSVNQGYTFRTLNVARNFIMMTPELGTYMNQTILAKVQDAINEYNTVGPYWFASRYSASIAESAMQNLYDYPAMFQAKAFILKQSRQELAKYLDVPAFERGDLFYIQNLIATIEAPSGVNGTTMDNSSQPASYP
jgi:hypothetical protein